MPRKRSSERASGFEARLVVFVVLAFALVGGAAYTIWPKDQALVELGPSTTAGARTAIPTGQPATSATADVTVRIDMEGFHPAKLSMAADRSVRLMILNPDSSHHSDGGGIHEFAVPSLGIDIKVPPETKMIVTLPATAPGEYPFYCDSCCGGKENPSMQGVLKVGA